MQNAKSFNLFFEARQFRISREQCHGFFVLWFVVRHEITTHFANILPFVTCLFPLAIAISLIS